jgi:hypothetical protein
MVIDAEFKKLGKIRYVWFGCILQSLCLYIEIVLYLLYLFISSYFMFNNQAQASEQFLASIKLASNKAICLKTKKINKSNMYF